MFCILPRHTSKRRLRLTSCVSYWGVRSWSVAWQRLRQRLSPRSAGFRGAARSTRSESRASILRMQQRAGASTAIFSMIHPRNRRKVLYFRRVRVLIFSCVASSPHWPGLPFESITRYRLLLMLLMHWPHALEQTSAVRQRGCMHVARTCRQPATMQGPMSC